MRRAVVILSLLVAVADAGTGQVTSIWGELRYQHQYQDYGSGTTYAKSIRQNPQLILGANGYVLSPLFLGLAVSSSVNATYNNQSSGAVSRSNRQYVFNFYNVNLDALRGYPVKFGFYARDEEIESTSDLALIPGLKFTTRQQQQRFSCAADRVSFLPSLSVFYTKTKSWSLSSIQPLSQVQHEWGVALSQSTPTSNVTASASTYSRHEQFTGIRYKYSRLQFAGERTLSENQRANLSAEYYKYDGFHSLSASVGFDGTYEDALHVNSNISARNFLLTGSSSLLISIAQLVQYRQNENLSYTLNLNGEAGLDVLNSEIGGARYSNRGFGGGLAVQHTRAFGVLAFSNGISVGYSQYRRRETQRSWTGGFSNGVNATFDGYQVTAAQTFNIQRRISRFTYDDKELNVSLTGVGVLPGDIQSQSAVEYRNERRYDNLGFDSRFRLLKVQQNLTTRLYQFVPLYVGLNGAINWHFNGAHLRFYSAGFNIGSPRFFVAELSLDYRLSRSYNPYYRQLLFEQEAQVNYQWRQLRFLIRLREFNYDLRRREAVFTVTRPF